MTTYLDLLPDDLYIKIYEGVNRSTLKDAAKIGLRRQIPKIGKKTNHNVIWHWMNNNPFESLSMKTDGYYLWSYCLCIGHTEREGGMKVLRDWTANGIGYSSHTTSTHVNKARYYADKVCNSRAEFENFDILNN